MQRAGSAAPARGAEGEVAARVRVRVRDATCSDMPLIHTMIHELAAFEGAPGGPQLSVEDLMLDGFRSSPAWFFALVGELDGVVAGYALCSRAYSSWTRRALYLEDLYVRPRARRRGLATALLARLCQMGVSLGARRVDWHVLESNAAARALYARLGARDLHLSEGRLALRLDAPAIAAAAAAAATPPPPPAPAIAAAATPPPPPAPAIAAAAAAATPPPPLAPVIAAAATPPPPPAPAIAAATPPPPPTGPPHV